MSSTNLSTTADEKSYLMSSMSGYQNPSLIESTTPLHFANTHFSDQVDAYGYFVSQNGKPPRSAEQRIILGPGEREPLWASVVISRVGNIDVKEESFKITYMLSLWWRINPEALGVVDIYEKMQQESHYYRCSEEDIRRIEAVTPIPDLRIHNGIESEAEDEATLRIYRGNTRCSYVCRSQLVRATVHCAFQLSHFPYDVQKLPIKFVIRRFEHWQYFNLTVVSIMYFKHALRISEWAVCIPEVKRSSPSHSASYIFLTLKRYHSFYEQNIVLTMLLLESLSLCVFMCDNSVAGSPGRAAIVVTLLLTIVAVKFTVSSNLPTLPYNTRLDEYFTIAACGLGCITVICLVPQLVTDEVDRRIANGWCFLLSLFVVVIGYVGWLRVVLRAEEVESRGFVKIEIIPNAKNYYAYRYAPTPFTDNTELINNWKKRTGSIDDSSGFDWESIA